MGPKEISYLFVDGASLHSRLATVECELGLQAGVLEVDFARLSVSFTKTFYYDAIPVRRDHEGEEDYRRRIAPRIDRHERAAETDGVHVYEGDARHRRGRGHEQKKVDVMIAVDMLGHTYRRNMHAATLLTGDVDFHPLLQALVREGMAITLWYPPGSTRAELLRAADRRVALTYGSVRDIVSTASQHHIPALINNGPNPRSGTRLKEWKHKGRDVELWRDDAGYAAVCQWNDLNVYHVRHTKLDVVKALCAGYPNFFGAFPDGS